MPQAEMLTAVCRGRDHNIPMAGHLGIHVKKAREAAGMSQRQLARVIGRSNALIGMIESGEKEASIETVRRIADACLVDPGELLGKGRGGDGVLVKDPELLVILRLASRLPKQGRKGLRELAEALLDVGRKSPPSGSGSKGRA